MKKWQVIDLVRTFCIVSVMESHAYDIRPFNTPWEAWFWGRFRTNGLYGVYLFFVVSGFLITNVIANNPGGLLKPDIYRFYIQRIGRIWPLCFLYLLFGVFIYTTIAPGTPVYSALFPAGNIYDFWFWISIPLFLFNWKLSFIPTLIYSQWILFWSLAVEEQFYLLYPIFLKKFNSSKNRSILLFLVIATGIIWRLLCYVHDPQNCFSLQTFPSPANFNLIATGILLYLAFKRYGPLLSQHKKTCALLCLAGSAITLLTYFGTRTNDARAAIWAPEVLGLGLVVFLLGGLHLPFFDSKVLKIFSLPGKYCYGCYLMHTVVILVIHPLLLKLNVYLGALFLTVVTTAIAAVSYHFFEMPMNRLIRRSFGRQTSR